MKEAKKEFIMGELNNAPILEFDTDCADEKTVKFFNQGKKEFWRFDEVKALGINQCIIFLSRSFELLTEIKRQCQLVYEFKSASVITPVFLYNKEVLIALCPLGGPAAANLMEELSYVGIRTFIATGAVGSLNEKVPIEKLIIPTEAIRDEGLSYHYLPASRTVATSRTINGALAAILKKHKKEFMFAKTWTTDAMYRETPNRVKRRVAEGALVVDMECASMAAVAKAKGFKFGQLLYTSDTIINNIWNTRKFDKVKLRLSLLQICIETCRELTKLNA